MRCADYGTKLYNREAFLNVNTLAAMEADEKVREGQRPDGMEVQIVGGKSNDGFLLTDMSQGIES